jgi:hypothetical protein
MGHREPLARLDTEPLVARLYIDHGMQSSAACKLSRAAEANDVVRR